MHDVRLSENITHNKSPESNIVCQPDYNIRLWPLSPHPQYKISNHKKGGFKKVFYEN